MRYHLQRNMLANLILIEGCQNIYSYLHSSSVASSMLTCFDMVKRILLPDFIPIGLLPLGGESRVLC